MAGAGELTRVSCTLTFGQGSSVSEASPARKPEQDRARWTAADLLSLLRIPLAAAFVLVSDRNWQLGIVGMAALTDLLDGQVARRFGSSLFGPVLDPIADKVFMAAAVAVVAFSGKLEVYEIVGVLLRDIVATVAFTATLISHRPRAIPARSSGKAVTVAQVLTLVAFLLDSPYLRPIAWATTGIAVIAIWDYYRVAPRAQKRLGT
jgi:CDP-diacylglycerol--glycerol-3-phosphate 3-phosphatidyltransferase/cardiolipin synthase